MTQTSKKWFTGSSLVLLAALFVALTVLTGVLLRGVRLDLTENNLYTVSEGTRSILRGIDEPINLYFYFSDEASREIPGLRTYATRVREMLEEFNALAGGKLNLQVIDPLPFSEAEDEATAQGLQAIPAGPGGDNLFLGLVGTNALDGREVIPFFDTRKESFLEYDLAKLIYNLSNPQRPLIGIMSSLPINRGFDPATRQMREPWVITQQIEQLFEVRSVPTTTTGIDQEIDVLMVVHPKNLSDETQYAIDQFVLRGGKLLLFVDPHAEMDTPPEAQMDPQAAMFAERSSNLEPLLAAWGVAYDPGVAVLDRRYGLQVNAGGGRGVVRHIGILALGEEAMNGEDVTLAQLNSINVSVSGHVAAAAGAETEFTPLISTSTDSATVPGERVRFLVDPAGLLDGFVATADRYTVAARVRGKLKTAFPDGKPGAADDAAAEDAAADGHLSESESEVDLVVVADTDLLADRLWVQTQSFFGQRLISAFANNGDFVVNLLDNLTGSSDLISIRGRATSQRPFTRVQELERQAEERFRATEQQLEEELRETERNLTELQAGRDDGNPLILSEQQRAELARFQEERLRIRKELRQVQRNLRSDIESLGTWLKVINIGLVPVLLTIFALFLAGLKARRRREG